MSRHVSDLEVHPRIINALKRARLTKISSLLLLSQLEVTQRTNLSAQDVHLVFVTASKLVLSDGEVCSAHQIRTGTCPNEMKHFYLPTGCKSIDAVLQGGILYPGITEICGESASGKTQLCMQICLQAQLNDEDSLYVCTEDVFPTKRLTQMTSHFVRSNKNQLPEGQTVSLVTDKIFIEHTPDLDDLWDLLDSRLPRLLASEKRSVKVVVIDSIASLFRVEFELSELAERAKCLAKFGLQLHKLSHRFRVCIVCVNQVSDLFDGQQGLNPDGTRRVQPALGLTWSHFVTTRLMLCRTNRSARIKKANQWVRDDPDGGKQASRDTVIRVARVLFAPHLPPSQCEYIVTQEGVQPIITNDSRNDESIDQSSQRFEE